MTSTRLIDQMTDVFHDTSECRYYQEIINERKYEREDVQEKTFTKWINAQLSRHDLPSISDLFQDLRDGQVLIRLMELLTKDKIKPEIGRLRVHYIGNVNKVINVLENHGIRLVNVNSGDIVDGNKKLTLALIWSIILTWQVKQLLRKTESYFDPEALEKSLVDWCNRELSGYRNVKIEDFSKSWKDGLAFNALLHKKNPSLFRFESILRNNAEENLVHAFRLAKDVYGVDQYLDVEDVLTETPDKKSIIVYVMALMDSSELDISDKLKFDSKLLNEIERYASDAGVLHQFLQKTTDDFSRRNVAVTFPDLRSIKTEFQSNETFMIELTKSQCRVGDILHRGNGLLHAPQGLTRAQEQQIRDTNVEINNAWETLRQRAMDRQSFLHTNLMKSQTEELNNLEAWILESEERVSRLETVGTDIPGLKSQLDTLMQFQTDINSRKATVSELQKMIIVVDDDDDDYSSSSQHHRTTSPRLPATYQTSKSIGLAGDTKKRGLQNTSSTSELERRLQLACDTWGSICRFVEERLVTVQEILVTMMEMQEELAHCERWIDDKENTLREINEIPMNDEAMRKSTVMRLNSIVKEADVIDTILDKVGNKEMELPRGPEEIIGGADSSRRPVSHSVQKYKIRAEGIARESNSLANMLKSAGNQDPRDVRTSFIPTSSVASDQPQRIADIIFQNQQQQQQHQQNHGKPNHRAYNHSQHRQGTFSDINEPSANAGSSDRQSGSSYGDSISVLKTSYLNECNRLHNWLASIEQVIDSQKFKSLDAHKKYSALSELLQKFKRYDHEFNQLNRMNEGLQSNVASEAERQGYQNKQESLDRRWHELERVVFDIRKKASLEVDETYVQNELNPVLLAIGNLRKWIQDGDKTGSDFEKQAGEKTKTIKAYQERIDYLQKLIDNMEREHGPNFAATNLRDQINEYKRDLDSANASILDTAGKDQTLRKQAQPSTVQKPPTSSPTIAGMRRNAAAAADGEKEEEAGRWDDWSRQTIAERNGQVVSVRERCERTVEHEEIHYTDGRPDGPVAATGSSANASNGVASMRPAASSSLLSMTKTSDLNTTTQNPEGNAASIPISAVTSTNTVNSNADNTPKMIHTLTNIYQFPSDSESCQKNSNLAYSGCHRHREEARDTLSVEGKPTRYNIQSIVEIVEKPPSRRVFNHRDVGTRSTSHHQEDFTSTSRCSHIYDISQRESKYLDTVEINLNQHYHEMRDSGEDGIAVADHNNNLDSSEQSGTSNNFLTAKRKLVSWLQSTESVLLGEKFEIAPIPLMEKRRSTLTELHERIVEKEADLEQVKKLSFDRLPHLSKEEAKSYERELNNLADRLSDAAVFVKDRSQKYSCAIKQLGDYEAEVKSVQAWFNDMELAFRDIENPAGDTHAIQTQLHNADDLLKEAKTMQSTVDKISESALEISGYASPDLTSRLREQADMISREWSDIVGRIKEFSSSLERALHKNKTFEDDLQELEMWVSDKNREVPADDGPVYYPEQITERLVKFKHISNEIIRKEESLKSIVEHSKEITIAASASAAQEILADVDKLKSNFSNLTRKLEHKVWHYEEIDRLYQDLRKIMDEENEWLNSLQNKTFSSVCTGMDAEEISEQLDSLEKLVKNHPSHNRKRIRDLKKTLEAKRVVIPALGNQITQFEFRWDQLHDEALKRIQSLGDCIVESQKIERQLLEIQNWMEYAERILNSPKTSVLDRSPEFDKLRKEFLDNEKTIQMLEDKASFFRLSGKVDASRRLEQQISTLKKRFDELHTRYRQCQVPADFDSKVQKCKKTLSDVEDNLQVVEIKTDDPDIIQMQLDSCLKLYSVLSEVQPELEHLIRVGRRIVNQGSIDDPDNITRQLDRLKQSFNDMGVKIMNGKDKLENALKSLRRFQREHRLVADWLNTAETELTKLESRPHLRSIDEQIDWIRSTKVDIRKLDSNFQILRSLQRDVEKEADKPLIPLTDKITDIERRVEQFNRRLKERINVIEDEQNKQDELYQQFNSTYEEFQTRLDKIDTMIYNAERSHTVDLEHINQINVDVDKLQNKLNELQTMGRSLIGFNDRYSSMVTPDLNNINRQYEECAERLASVKDISSRRKQVQNNIPIAVSLASERLTPTLGKPTIGETFTYESRQQHHFSDEEHEQLKKTTTTSRHHHRSSGRRRLHDSLTESTEDDDGELTDDEFRKKYGRCLAYLQLIDKLMSKGALPESGELARDDIGSRQTHQHQQRVIDKQMIERVIKETEKTIHIIERKEPDRARKLKTMLSRLEDQLQRIESKIDAQGTTGSTIVHRKSDKVIDDSIPSDVPGYTSSDFLYNTDFAADDRSTISETLVVQPPVPTRHRYSRYDRQSTTNRQLASEQQQQPMRLQPLLRVRSLRAIDRNSATSSYAAAIENQQQRHRRVQSLERGGLIRSAAPMYCYNTGIVPTWGLVPFYPAATGGMAASAGVGRMPVYRERIVDKHIAYREQGHTAAAAASSSKTRSSAGAVSTAAVSGSHMNGGVHYQATNGLPGRSVPIQLINGDGLSSTKHSLTSGGGNVMDASSATQNSSRMAYHQHPIERSHETAFETFRSNASTISR